MGAIAEFGKENTWWISVLVAIIVGFLVNLVSPNIRLWIAEWWTTRSLSASQNRLNRLEARLRYVTEFYDDKDRLLMQSIWAAFRVLFLISLGLAVNSFIIIFGIGFILLIPAARVAWRHAQLINDVMSYNDFGRRTESEIEELRIRVNTEPKGHP